MKKCIIFLVVLFYFLASGQLLWAKSGKERRLRVMQPRQVTAEQQKENQPADDGNGSSQEQSDPYTGESGSTGGGSSGTTYSTEPETSPDSDTAPIPGPVPDPGSDDTIKRFP